ncbi:MAG: TlpA family protein disulfide reductase [Planctomycetaceae bacterium]
MTLLRPEIGEPNPGWHAQTSGMGVANVAQHTTTPFVPQGVPSLPNSAILSQCSLKTVLLLAAVVLTCGALAGCGKTEKTEPPKSDGKTEGQKPTPKDGKPKPPETPLPAFVPPKEITLKEVTPKQLDAFIAEQTTKNGRAVLIDYWATWCPPCIKGFPHTVGLSEKYAKEGLVVISMSMDNFEARKKAIGILKDKKAQFFNFVSNDKEADPEKLASLFNIPDTIPYYKVYGPDGKLVKAISAEAKPEEIDAAVLTALGYK